MLFYKVIYISGSLTRSGYQTVAKRRTLVPGCLQTFAHIFIVLEKFPTRNFVCAKTCPLLTLRWSHKPGQLNYFYSKIRKQPLFR